MLDFNAEMSLAGDYVESAISGKNGGTLGEGQDVSSDDEEYERMTAAEVLEKLEEAWINEKFAPELLQHKTEIVDCILLQIKEMEENLSHVSKGDFVAKIHQMELDRVRYVLCSYLRTRLKKLEKYVVHILDTEGSHDSQTAPPSSLSPEELVYAKDYAESLDKHFGSLLLRHMPANFQKIDKKKAVQRPNLDQYVFMKAVERMDQVIIDPEVDGADRQAVNFLPGSQYILRYHPVSSLVKSGAAKLI